MTSRSRCAASAGAPTSPKVETPNSTSADEARERVGVPDHRAVAEADGLGAQRGELALRRVVELRVDREGVGRIAQPVAERDDAEVEEDVGADEHAVALAPERHVARRVTRRVEHDEPGGELVALLQAPAHRDA